MKDLKKLEGSKFKGEFSDHMQTKINATILLF